MNSNELIGKVRERWAEIGNEDPDRVDERYRGDPWRLFYAGWIEGRADMVSMRVRGETKGNNEGSWLHCSGCNEVWSTNAYSYCPGCGNKIKR